jgi:hypothetical protein
MKAIFILLSFISSLYSISNDLKIDLKNFKDTDIPIPTPMKADETTSKDVNEFFSSLDKIWGSCKGPKEKIISKSIEPETQIYNLDLNSILDRYLYTPIKFKTSRHTDVILSISKADNCPNGKSNCNESDKFLLTLTYANSTIFVPIKEIINLGIFMQGSKTVIIDNESYTLKIYGNISNINKSKIEIRGPGGIVLSKELGEVLNIFSSFGYKIILSKEYRIVYGRKIIRDLNNFRFSNQRKVFIFEYPINQDSDYYGVDESKYNGKSFYFEGIGKNYLFKLSNGYLIISRK